MEGKTGGKMRGNMPDARNLAEIERLERTAAYYDKLGCVDVARSLRRLAAAKKKDAPNRNRGNA